MSGTKPDKLHEQETRSYWFTHYLAVRFSWSYFGAYSEYKLSQEFWARHHTERYDNFRAIPGLPRRIDENEKSYRERAFEDFEELMEGYRYLDHVEGPGDLVLLNHREFLRVRFGLFSGELPRPLSISELSYELLIEACREVIELETRIKEAAPQKRGGLLEEQRGRVAEKLSLDSGVVSHSMAPVIWTNRDGDGTILSNLGDSLDACVEELRLLHLESSNQKVGIELPISEDTVIAPWWPGFIGKPRPDRYVSLLADGEMIGEITSTSVIERRLEQEARGQSAEKQPVPSQYLFVPVPHKTRAAASMRDLAKPISGLAMDGAIVGTLFHKLRKRLGLEPIHASTERDWKEEFGGEVLKFAMPEVQGFENIAKNILSGGMARVAEGEVGEAGEKEIVFWANRFLEETGAKPDYHVLSWQEIRNAASFGPQRRFRAGYTTDADSECPTIRNHPAPPFSDPAYSGRNLTTSKLLPSVCMAVTKAHPEGPSQNTEFAQRLRLADDVVLDADRKWVANATDRGEEFICERDRWRNLRCLHRGPLIRN